MKKILKYILTAILTVVFLCFFSLMAYSVHILGALDRQEEIEMMERWRAQQRDRANK